MQSVLKLLLILAERVTEIELTVVKQQRDEICMRRVHRGRQGALGKGGLQFTQVTPT